MAKIIYNMGPKRPKAPGASILSLLEATATAALGAGSSVRVTSGTGEHGSVRHRGGHAADVQFIDSNRQTITLDDPRAIKVVIEAARQGVSAFGAGVEYMGNKTFHMDVYPLDQYTESMGRTWGSWGKANGAAFIAAYSGDTSVQVGDEILDDDESDNPIVQNNPFSLAGVAKSTVSLYTQQELDLLASFDLFRRVRENRPELIDIDTLFDNFG